MKELLKFYNSITNESAKREIEQSCSDFFDPKEPDGYKRPKDIDTPLDDVFTKSDYEYGDRMQEALIVKVLQSMDYDHMKELLFSKNNLSDWKSGKYMRSDFKNYILLLNSEDYRKLRYDYLEYRNGAANRAKYVETDLCSVLLFNKDFSKKALQQIFDKALNRLETENELGIFQYKALCLEIFGADNMKKVWKHDESYIRIFSNFDIPEDISNAMFDELFFCENGWTDEQKNNVIRNINYMTIERFELFVKKILSVDMSYAKLLPPFFNSHSGLATLNEIINQKKPENEYISRSEAPRYCKHFKTLLRALYACLKENVCKTRATQLKEVAPLIQLYGYDFNCICEAMYPEAF